MSKRILLLASGSGSLAQALFDAPFASRCNFVGLISDRDSLARVRARSAGVKDIYLPMMDDRGLWDQELVRVTESFTPDLVISVGFMRILSATYVERFKVMNTHPSLLPAFPGAHAVRDALAAAIDETGASVHWVDDGVDTGALIAQRSVRIEVGDTEESLHERIKIVERGLIVEVLIQWLNESDGAQ